jgi:4-hydroxybenzoate polyprenyltransferase
MASWIAKAWRGIFALGAFIRFTALGGTVILPLLGAATVSRQLAGFQVVGIIGVAVTFHNFAYVLNDVIDLPIDRTEPRRAEFPLVQGVIEPWQALAFALLQVPLGLGLTAWLGGKGHAYTTLGMAFALMAVYNLWGKRAFFPPLTDTAQGLAWAFLVLYGAVVVPGHPTELTSTIFIFIVVFIVLVNGVHGSLRDLVNDLNCGVRSTAILLGARPQGATGLVIPRRLMFYALALQVILVGVTLLPLVRNDFGYKPVAWNVTLVAVLVLAVLSLCLLRAAARSAGDRQDMIAAGILHLVLSLSSLIVLFALYLDRSLLAVIGVGFIIPLLTLDWLYDALRRVWQRGAQALQARACASMHRKRCLPPTKGGRKD